MSPNYSVLLVEYYFPQSLSPARLDRYLAGGWFRSGPSLFRTQVLCLDGNMYSVINIRVPLDGYRPGKSLRKLYNQNSRKFRVEIGEAFIDLEKERLYQTQKKRFKGFIFDTLEEFLYAGSAFYLFDTREVRVYDGDKLVAVSYFDAGSNSIASLLGLYDQSYADRSLGMFTMLVEIHYAQSKGLKFYYPGYVLEGMSAFDYKLRLGSIQYHNWKGRWRPFPKVNEETLVVEKIQQGLVAAQRLLDAKCVPYESSLYPFFSVGYLEGFAVEFLKSVSFLKLFPDSFTAQTGLDLVLEYVVEEGCYLLSRVRRTTDFLDFMSAEFSEEFLDHDRVQPALLTREELIARDFTPDNLVEIALQIGKTELAL
ncbi:hypothetical protein [Pontibacter sp. G13]|uniref:hypothetical protein n=1 Tax=Pontibacter sp. G13 TaxID=3074898 RepID=UPI00288A394C|nr:hypothetical protein [Pontibacter sp. G13]WNJ16392.1 hypothetical protein RJD25_16125 [Pontibacter sp. G13]